MALNNPKKSECDVPLIFFLRNIMKNKVRVSMNFIEIDKMQGFNVIDNI